MTTMIQKLRGVVESGRKVFGHDLDMVVARTPMWGHDDCCILVYGKNHKPAAESFGLLISGAKITQDTTPAWNGLPERTYSVVEFSVSARVAS
jgi:hypothetical protein